MPKKLTLRYDRIGDTGAIENLEILFFSRRMQTQNFLELPILAQLQLVS